MFDHLSHLQVLAAAGFPLSLFFLDRLLEQRRRRDALLFAAVFTAQTLANGYYALFLSLAVGLILVIELPRRGGLADGRVWRALALAGILSAALAAPFFRQYVLMEREMGLHRQMMDETTLGSYLAVPPINRLYGARSAPLGRPEGRLFPGATALLLALTGAAAFARRTARATTSEVVLVSAAGVAALAAAGVAWRGPLSLPPLLSVSSPLRPVMLAALLLALAALLRAFRPPRTSWSAAGVYAALGLFSFTLTFGTRGPYRLLAGWVPGFDAVRAVSRVHVITMLAIAVLAALGAAALLNGRRRGLQFAAFTVFAGLLAVEYASVPLPLARVTLDGEEMRVYRFIDRVAGERDAILELPLPRDRHEWWRLECRRMLASTLHWRPLVNGFSGLAPPLYEQLVQRWQERTVAENVADARALGVRYLLVHRTRDGRPWPAGRELATTLHRTAGVRLRQHYPDAWVFELAGESGGDSRTGPSQPLARLRFATLAATVQQSEIGLAADGQLATRWSTGRPQQPGDTVTVDLGERRPVAGLRLHLGTSPQDYPRGWTVSSSDDGVTWRMQGSGEIDCLPITAFLSPRDPQLDIVFPATATRFIRLTCTANHPEYYWSIHELELLLAP